MAKSSEAYYKTKSDTYEGFMKMAIKGTVGTVITVVIVVAILV